jgi:hypothetical protein
MSKCTPPELSFPSFDRRQIEADFCGGNVSSDGGILLLREADRRLGLVAALDAVLPDPRHPVFITHRQVDLLRQRVYGLALGYEDLNDHDTLRHDLAWQTALERDEELASDSTLCRLEQRVDRKAALAFHEVLIEKFIASFKEAPNELILDFDATDDRVHGNQEGRHARAEFPERSQGRRQQPVMNVCHVADIEGGAFSAIHPLRGGNAFGVHREELFRLEQKQAPCIGERDAVV